MPERLRHETLQQQLITALAENARLAEELYLERTPPGRVMVGFFCRLRQHYAYGLSFRWGHFLCDACIAELRRLTRMLSDDECAQLVDELLSR